MAEALGIILLKIVGILAAAKLAGELFERAKLPGIVGELLAGILIGPTVFGLMDLTPAAPHTAEMDIIKFIAGFGAIILLFEVGLESNVKALMKVGKSATNVAIIGIAASFLLGYLSSLAFAKLGIWKDDQLLHIFVGATFTATSVGITARVLSDMGRLITNEARIILGAAVLDDVGGLLILAIVSGLAAGSLTALGILTTAGVAIGFLVVSVLVGMWIMPKVTTIVSGFKTKGVLLATAVAFGLIMAYFAELVHLAGIVGAFAAGLILAQTKEHHEIFNGVRPIGEIFVPFFFVTMGLQVNLREIPVSDIGLVLGVAAVLTVIAILGKLACGLGVTDKGISRMAVGVGMVPRGEVGLIFASFGLLTLGLATWEYAAILIVVMVTTVITPVWLRSAFRHVKAEAPAAAEEAPADHPVAVAAAHGKH